MANEQSPSYAMILAWLVPVLMSAMLGILAWMGTSVSDISKTLAVAVSKIDDHERRIQFLEHK